MYSLLLKSFADMFSSFFNWRTSASDNQLGREVIEDKQNYEKACNYAEKAIEIIEKDAVFIKKQDRFRFKFFVKKFRKYK